jgi:hypothetical protein
MKHRLVRRPSPAMVVALIALLVAAGGTALAAGHLVSGDSLIKRGTLSGNRLRNHTVTGTQINLAKLGKVPTATHADTATAADSATTATNSTLAAGLTLLAKGRSESGFYAAAAGATGFVGEGITYSQPMFDPIRDDNIIWNKAGTTSPHCSGLGHADPGYLCLYDNEEHAVIGVTFFSDDNFSSPSVGAILYWDLSAAGYVSGEYTVTALR